MAEMILNDALQAAAKLLRLPEEMVAGYSQETQNSMEAIALLYGIETETDETILQEALHELEELCKTEILQESMHEVAEIIGFDFDAETLCGLEKETQAQLLYLYMEDSTNIAGLYEVARMGLVHQELANVAEILEIEPEVLYALPEETQETLYGIYLYHYGDYVDNPAENSELIERLKEVLQQVSE